MLVVLLGSGEGLAHGVDYQMRDDAMNSIWVMSGTTSQPFQGRQPGRPIQFTNEDHDETARTVTGPDQISSRFMIRGTTRVRYRGEVASYDIRSVHPAHQDLEKTVVTAGRYLNNTDIEEFRKVAVIGAKVEQQLFSEPSGRSAVGEYLLINEVAFRVVGVFTDVGDERELERIYLPLTTSQRVFSGGRNINMFLFSTGDANLPESEVMAKTVRGQLADRHDFAEADERAVFVRNAVEASQRVFALMQGIRTFIWIVGIGTLVAGVAGVSNIMLIAVKERTREIGVRKALGATPGSILALVLQESVLVTTVAGYAGLVLGVAALEVFSRAVPNADFFRDPRVDLKVALSATLLLVIAGTIAGFFPARRAASVRPIEALRDE
jgi:putative ABC transport system permease protein